MLSDGRVQITCLKPLHSGACGTGKQLQAGQPFQHWKRLEQYGGLPLVHARACAIGLRCTTEV